MANKMGENGDQNLRKVLVRELQWLRRGEGATLRRLSSTPTLLFLAAGEATAGGDDHAIHAAQQLLLRGMEQLGRSLGAGALRVALAIDREEPLTLTQRRSDFAVKHDKHPDTVENHENRAIQELALRIIGLTGGSNPCSWEGTRGDFDGAGEDVVISAALSMDPRESSGLPSPTYLHLIRSNGDLLAALRGVIDDAEHCLTVVGSRSRDAGYLEAIEKKVERTDIVHYRVLCGPPHWPVLKAHLTRLLEINMNLPVGGHQRMFIGMLSDFCREPEQFLCANERRAVIVLPSLNGMERYDTALQLEGDEYGMGYTRLVQEMYAASQPIKSPDEVAALPLFRR